MGYLDLYRQSQNNSVKGSAVTGTAQTLITLPRTINSIKTINTVQNSIGTNAVQLATGLTERAKTYNSLTSKKPNNFLDQYDPYQINSVLDVLSKSFDPLENGGQFFSLSTFFDSGKEWFNNVIKNPLTDGVVDGAFIMNNLVNFGETMDVLSNIVKATLPATWTTAIQYDDIIPGEYNLLQRLRMATGIRVKGRYTFDIDFNFDNNRESSNLLELAADLVGEIVVDPINWFSLGSKEIFEAMAKPKMVNAITEATKLSGFTDDAVNAISGAIKPGVAKRLAHAYYSKNSEEFYDIVDNLWGVIQKNVSFDNATQKRELYFKYFEGMGKVMRTAEEAATFKMGSTIIDSLQSPKILNTYKTMNTMDFIDKNWTRFSGLPVFTPMVHIAKYGSPKVAKYVQSHIFNATTVNKNPRSGLSIAQYEFNKARGAQGAAEINQALADTLNVTEDEATDMVAALQAQSIKQQLISYKRVLNIFDEASQGNTKKLTLDQVEDICAQLEQAIIKDNDGAYKNLQEYVDAVKASIDKFPELAARLGDYTSTLKLIENIERSMRGTAANKAISDLFDLLYNSEAINIKTFKTKKTVKYSNAYLDRLLGFKDHDLQNAEAVFTIGESNEIIDAFRRVDSKDATEIKVQDFVRRVRAAVFKQYYDITNSIVAVQEKTGKQLFAQDLLNDLLSTENGAAVYAVKLDYAFKIIMNPESTSKDIKVARGIFRDYNKVFGTIMRILETEDAVIRGAEEGFQITQELLSAWQVGTPEALQVVQKIVEKYGLTKQLSPDDLIELQKKFKTKLEDVFMKLNSSELDINNLDVDIRASFNNIFADVIEKDSNGNVISSRAPTIEESIARAQRFIDEYLDVDIQASFNNIFADVIEKDSNGNVISSRAPTIEESIARAQRFIDEYEEYIKNLWDESRTPQMRPDKESMQELLSNELSTIREVRQVIYESDPSSFYHFLSEDNTVPIIQFMVGRAAQTENLMYGSVAQKLRGVLNDAEHPLRDYFSEDLAREAVNNSDTSAEIMRINQDILQYAKKINKYRECDEAFMHAVNDDGGAGLYLYEVVQNVLESYHDVDPLTLAADSGFGTRFSMMQAIQEKLRMGKSTERISLDWYRQNIVSGERAAEFQQAFLEMAGLDQVKAEQLFNMAMEGHNALNDSIMTEAVIRSQLPDLAKEFDECSGGQKIILFDTETFGINPNLGYSTMLQIGAYQWGDAKSLIGSDLSSSNSFKIRMLESDFDKNNVPETSVLIKFYGEDTKENLIKKFKDEFYSAKTDSEVITEEDILIRFQEEHGDANTVIGMNSTGFDNYYIKQRASQYPSMANRPYYPIKTGSKACNRHVDAMAELYKAQGVPYITASQELAINKYFDDLAEHCGELGSIRGINPNDLRSAIKDGLDQIELLNKSNFEVPSENGAMSYRSYESLRMFYEDLLETLDSEKGSSVIEGIKSKAWNDTIVKDFISEPLTEADWAEYGAGFIGNAEMEDTVRLNRTWARLKEMFDPPHKKYENGVLVTIDNGKFTLEEFKEQWLYRTNPDGSKVRIRPDPTSIQAVINGFNSMNSPVGYKFIRRAIDENTFEFNINDIKPYTKFWEAVTLKYKIAHDRARAIKQLDLVLGEHGVLFKTSEDLTKALEDAIALGNKSPAQCWWATLDLSKINDDALRYAYWDTITRDIKYRSIIANGAPYPSIEPNNIFAEHIGTSGQRVYRGIDSPIDHAEQRRQVYRNAVRESVYGDDIPEEVIDGASPDNTILLRAQQADEAYKVLRNLKYYIEFEIPGGANSYAANAAQAKLKNATKILFARKDRQEILDALTESKIQYTKDNYTRFFNKVLQVDETGALTEDAKKYLTQYMIYDSPIICLKTDIDVDPDYNIFVEALLSHDAELSEWGIKHMDSTSGKRVYYLSNEKSYNFDFTYINKQKSKELGVDVIGSAEYNGIHYDPPVRDMGSVVGFAVPEQYVGDADVTEIYDAINQGRQAIKYFTNGASENAVGRALTEGSLSRAFRGVGIFTVKGLTPADIIIPKELSAMGYFALPRFNRTYLGPANVATTADPKTLTNTSILADTFEQLAFAARRTTNNALYTDLYFNKDYGMHFDLEGVFKSVYDKHGGATDEALNEIAEAFKYSNGDLIVSALVKDNTRQGFHAIQIPIETADDIRRAIDLNASIIPYSVYSKSFDAINNVKAAQHWYTYIPQKLNYLYKTGYLMGIGTWIRNAIDSPFKTMVSTQEPVGTVRYLYEAQVKYAEYDNILKKMYIYNKDMALSHTSFKRWYKKFGENEKLSLEEFEKLYGFFEDGPSSGEARMINKFRSSKSLKQSKSFSQRLSNFCLYPMSVIERSTRLAQFLQLEDQGYSKATIFRKISETQFDYSTKSNATKVIESFIPFYNFMKLNFEYWLDAICEHPHLARFLDDLIGIQQNSFNVSPEEAAANRSYYYHMSHGNIMTDTESGFVLKLNPSYMDAFNILMEPVNLADTYFAARKFSVLSALSDYTQNSTIIGSIFAPIQNILSNTIEEYTIDSRMTSVPFGKYYGQPVSDTLKDTAYIQSLVDSSANSDNDWLRKKYPNVWRQIIEHLDKTDRLMYFGKYEGMTVQRAMQEDPGYCQYLMSQEWFRDKYKPIFDVFVANGLNEIKEMPWGKYKGQPMETVLKDTNYINWLMSQPWFASEQPVVYNYIVNGQKTIVPESELITETLLSTEEAMGMFAYGTTLDEINSRAHFKNIMENTLKDTSTYPIIGVLYQRLLGEDSTKQHNIERLENARAVEQYLGTIFPGTFGAAVRYDNTKSLSSEASADATKQFYKGTTTEASIVNEAPHKETNYNARRYYSPARNYNYYKPQEYNKYKYNRGFRKYLGAGLDLLRLKLNVSSLHLT